MRKMAEIPKALVIVIAIIVIGALVVGVWSAQGKAPTDAENRAINALSGELDSVQDLNTSDLENLLGDVR